MNPIRNSVTKACGNSCLLWESGFILNNSVTMFPDNNNEFDGRVVI